VALERGHPQIARLLEASGKQAALHRALAALPADSGQWKVGAMKEALRLGGVDSSGATEKAELVKLVEGLREAAGDAARPAAAPASPAAAPTAAPARAPPAAAPPPPAAPAKAAAAALDDDDSDDDDGASVRLGAERAKEKGNAAFSAGDFANAVKHFSLAIRLDPKSHIFYSNRSAAYASLGQGARALDDAEKCLSLAPAWAKGFSRKGAALVLTGNYKSAIGAYKRGLELEPQNGALQKGLDDLRAALREGDVPSVADAPPKPAADSVPRGAPTTAASAAAAAAAAASPPARRSSPPPVRSNAPVGQQWIDAAKKGDRKTMAMLLEEAGPEKKDELVHHRARGIGHSAMHWAGFGGDCKLMEWLLSLGADVNGCAAARARRTPRRAAGSALDSFAQAQHVGGDAAAHRGGQRAGVRRRLAARPRRRPRRDQRRRQDGGAARDAQEPARPRESDRSAREPSEGCRRRGRVSGLFGARRGSGLKREVGAVGREIRM